jgi:hypothetical protein
MKPSEFLTAQYFLSKAFCRGKLSLAVVFQEKEMGTRLMWGFERG